MDESKRFKFRILPEHKLIIESWTGEFSLKEIIDLKCIEAMDPNWKDYYDVLADDRYINILNEPIDKDNNIYLPLGQKFIKKRKTAILTRLPDQVVAPTLLNMQKPSEALVEIEIFSTVEAALRWLGIDIIEIAKINRILDQLSKD